MANKNEKVTTLPGPPDKIPILFPIGDRMIDGAVVRTLSFQAFADCVSEAQGMKQPKTFEARLRRLLMVRQVQYYVGNAITPVTVEEVLKMPIPAARVIAARVNVDEEAKPGKILRSGDGIEQAVVYELGTPIPTGQGKQPIRELEFMAKTYGEIEDVLAAGDSIQQALQLIATVAKPLGSSLSLLPSWALTQITVTDGLMISREVLPHFLGSPSES